MQLYSTGRIAPDSHHARIHQWIGENSNTRSHAVQMKGTELKLSILDVVGKDPWTGRGATAEWLQGELKSHKSIGTIHLLLNSPGGDYFEGVAIHNLLKQSGAKVTVEVIGMAASAASVIAMAGDEIQIHDGAMLMVHEAWSFAMGKAKDLEAAAALLRKVNESAIDIYEKRTGLARAEVNRLVEAETWLKADEAVASGWADKHVPARGRDRSSAAPSASQERTHRPYAQLSWVERASLKRRDPALFAKLLKECPDPTIAPPERLTLGQMFSKRKNP